MVPIHFEVTNVFPIEDGIIVKALHNKDLIQFDPYLKEQETLRTSKKDQAFSYFTLTSHPLDDINPLSLGG